MTCFSLTWSERNCNDRFKWRVQPILQTLVKSCKHDFFFFSCQKSKCLIYKGIHRQYFEYIYSIYVLCDVQYSAITFPLISILKSCIMVPSYFIPAVHGNHRYQFPKFCGSVACKMPWLKFFLSWLYGMLRIEKSILHRIPQIIHNYGTHRTLQNT